MKVFLVLFCGFFFSCQNHSRIPANLEEPKPTKEQKQYVLDFIEKRIQDCNRRLIDSPDNNNLKDLKRILLEKQRQVMAKK